MVDILTTQKQELEAVATEQAQMIVLAKAEIEQVRTERDTLRDRNSITRTIQESLERPDIKIEAEFLPEKKNITGKVVEPEKVKLTRADYEWLRERATITTAIMNAWNNLQRYGKKLWAEVDRNARVQAAERRAEKAEKQTREDAYTIKQLTQRARVAEEQAQEQEQFMRGMGIWQRFMQRIAQRHSQEYHHTR